MLYQSRYEEIASERDESPMCKKSTLVMAVVTLLGLMLFVNSMTSSSDNSVASTVSTATESQNSHGVASSPLELSTTLPVCSQPDYSKTTLKLAKEESFVAMFHDTRGQKKFEASDMTQIGDYFYVVFDNLYSIGRVAVNLPFSSNTNQLVGPTTADSGFEALFYDQPSDHFFFVQESIQEAKAHFHAVITEAIMHQDMTDYKVVERCISEFQFTSDNKGFEGAVGIRHNGTGELHILGLCEGNFCEGGAKGRESGNGRLVVLQKHPVLITDSHGVVNVNCAWDVLKVVNIPKQANFVDYSSIAIYGDHVAVSSQESSALWIGKIDRESFELSEEGVVYYFPRDHECNVQYCNIEGITWLNDHLFAAVSDKMKSAGRQDFRCLDKDQSLHVFVLP